MDINNQTIQFTQTVSRRWANKQYNAMSAMIPYLHPRINGAVLKNGIERVYTMLSSSDNTRLMVTGNINEHDKKIYFNSCYIDFANCVNDWLKIELECQWITSNVALNVISDFPKIFHIEKPNNCNLNKIMKTELTYNVGYDVICDTVKSGQCDLCVKKHDDTGDYIKTDNLNKLLLEAEILGDKDW